MAWETREMEGTLFKNDKEGVESRPDYTGTCMVNGQLLRMAAWVNRAKSGRTYLAFKFQEDERPGSRAAPSAQVDLEDDDLIPF